MKLSRRDVLFGLGGSAVGAALTPVPWKLLDDVSIRTQHRAALPVTPRGPVAYRAAACTLCPGGCALRVRTVGGRPVSVAPAAGHPLGAGACAVGLTLHHLAGHPLRLASPVRREGGRLVPVSRDRAVAELAAAAAACGRAGQAVMVVDRRPGRVVSAVWREWLDTLPNGVHAAPPGEDATLAALAESAGGPLGLDLERARTVVSFGAPFLDGWGRPGRVRAARRGLRVVQVDAWRSPSAELADQWVPIEPGSEGALALGLARVIGSASPGRLAEETLGRLEPFTPELVGRRTGLHPDRVAALARSLAASGPVVAIGGGDAGGGPLGRDVERAIALLNVALGSVGVPGGVVPRRALPGSASATPLDEVPAGGVGLVLLDAADDGRALPWGAVARTLAPGALVVSLSPFDHGTAAHASLIVPAPAPLEALDEVLPAADDASAVYAVAPALVAPPEGATDAVALVQALSAAGGRAGAADSLASRLEARAAALHADGRGRFLARGDRVWTRAAPADGAAAWKTLAEGGLWIDGSAAAVKPAPPPAPSAAALAAWAAPVPATTGLALVAFAARATAGSTPVSPLLTKLYQETELRASAAVAILSPETAAALGLGEGQPVAVEGTAGRAIAALRTDASLPPGRVALAAGPDRAALQPRTRGGGATGALAAVAPAGDGTWRTARVVVREA
jgi:anaerobic selenocysteine-containing dehydrogenase